MRDRLLGAFERGRFHIWVEILQHAKRYKDDRTGHANRQQDVKRRAREIDPEIAKVRDDARIKPRIRATAIAMPVAADREF